MNESTKSVSDIYAFNTRLVRLGLQDLTNTDAVWQMRDGKGSSISYLVGHLLSSCLGALKMLGKADGNPYAPRFASGTPATDGSDYPHVSELAQQWDEIAERFATALEALTGDEALAVVEGFPVPDQTVRGALMFRAWHESYHVGQIGLIRTQLGYPALRDRLTEAAKQEK